MKMKIDPRHVSVGRLFSKNNIFRIPKYQRNYAWTDEQITDFIDDLRRCHSSRGVGTPRDHFFGGIVSIEEKIAGSDTYIFYLVDGQQRMATFSLFIASVVTIYKSLLIESEATSDESNQKIIRKRISDLTEAYLKSDVERNTEIETVDRLEVSEADRQYFKDIINDHPRTKVTVQLWFKQAEKRPVEPQATKKAWATQNQRPGRLPSRNQGHDDAGDAGK